MTNLVYLYFECFLVFLIHQFDAFMLQYHFSHKGTTDEEMTPWWKIILLESNWQIRYHFIISYHFLVLPFELMYKLLLKISLIHTVVLALPVGIQKQVCKELLIKARVGSIIFLFLFLRVWWHLWASIQTDSQVNISKRQMLWRNRKICRHWKAMWVIDWCDASKWEDDIYYIETLCIYTSSVAHASYARMFHRMQLHRARAVSSDQKWKGTFLD